MGFEAVELEVEGSAGVGAGGGAEAEAVLACELLDLWKGGVLDVGFEVDEEHGGGSLLVWQFVSFQWMGGGWEPVGVAGGLDATGFPEAGAGVGDVFVDVFGEVEAFALEGGEGVGVGCVAVGVEHGGDSLLVCQFAGLQCWVVIC